MDKIIKEKAYTIRGIAILAIIICHTPTVISQYCHADLAVSIFFFFTGYFIMNNYLNKKYLDKRFLIRKIYNIYIPFVISNIIYILNYRIINNQDCFSGIFDLSLKILGIVPVNGYLWFIPHIIIYYIIFYLLYIKKRSSNIRYYLIVYLTYLSIVIGLFSILKIWGGYSIFEHLLLAVGSIFSMINKKSHSKNYSIKKEKIIFCIIFVLLFMYSLIHSNLITAIVLQVMVPFFLLIIIKYNKTLDFLGKNSLLLYLYHIPIIYILNYYLGNRNELVYIILYLILNISIIVIWKTIEKFNNKTLSVRLNFR